MLWKRVCRLKHKQICWDIWYGDAQSLSPSWKQRHEMAWYSPGSSLQTPPSFLWRESTCVRCSQHAYEQTDHEAGKHDRFKRMLFSKQTEIIHIPNNQPRSNRPSTPACRYLIASVLCQQYITSKSSMLPPLIARNRNSAPNWAMWVSMCPSTSSSIKVSSWHTSIADSAEDREPSPPVPATARSRVNNTARLSS